MAESSPNKILNQVQDDTFPDEPPTWIVTAKRYWVYILTNAHDTVLYIGVTGDIERRVREHKSGAVEGFTRKYNLTKLVYLEAFSEVEDAIYREKQLKNWRRTWKEELIRKENPAFADLSASEPAMPNEIPRRPSGPHHSAG